MHMSKHTIGLLLIAVVALGAMTGVAAAEGDLGVTVDDADGEPTVTVTENGTRGRERHRQRERRRRSRERVVRGSQCQ